MFKQARYWAFLVGVGLVLAGALVLNAGKTPPNVQVRADFQALTDLGVPCKILNDPRGPYVTNSKDDVSAWITGAEGNLFLEAEHHSSRSLLVLFPAAYADCAGWLPDSGFIDGRSDAPIDFFQFGTRNYTSHAEPKLNLLTMPIGVAKPVRLWTTFCTTQLHGYFMNYDPAAGGDYSGTVQVTAYDDTVPPDGKIDRWVMTLVDGTGDAADIFKSPEAGSETGKCPFGTYPMPFKLVLYRR